MTKEKKFPCECGKSFETAEEFTDHAHADCKAGVIPWKPTADYLAARAAAEKRQ